MQRNLICSLMVICVVLFNLQGQIYATVFQADELTVELNGTPLFLDSFDDGVPPPNAPDYLIGGSTSYSVSGVFTEFGGKLELNVDDGVDGLTPTGIPARIHSVRLRTSTNPASSRNLGTDDTFVVSGVFDLIMPNANTEAFRTSLSDRTQPQGPDDETNDVVRVSVSRSDRDRPTCRDPITQAPVGAQKGEVVLRLSSLDFVLDTATTLDCFKLDLTGNPDQIRLTLAKDNSATSEVTGSFAYLKNGLELSTTTFLATDTIFNSGVLPDGTPFSAEQHTRPQIDAFFIPGIPAPNLSAELTSSGPGDPASLRQTVDTPSEEFTVTFDYLFASTAGELTVYLDTKIVGSVAAPAVVESNPMTASIVLNDPLLLGQTAVELEFLLESSGEAAVLLDNIDFPGLVNGDFQVGSLTPWTFDPANAGVTTLPNVVALDVKPVSCPNSVNIQNNDNGVIPVAILGAADFDVGNIDVDSIMLEGVAPLRSETEDVGTPFEPLTGREDAMDCHELGADGLDDLTVKFDAQKVAAALGAVEDGDVIVVKLTAELLDGTAVRGEDVIVVRKK